MKYINERYMNRIKELCDKSETYIFIKQKIPMKDWIVFTGFFGNQYGGKSSIYINGLNEDEKQELIMYGYYTGDEFFDIQRDSYLASKTATE